MATGKMTQQEAEAEAIRAVKEMNERSGYKNKSEPKIVSTETVGNVVIYALGFTGQDDDFHIHYATVRNNKAPANPFNSLGGVGRELHQILGIRGFIQERFENVVLSLLALLILFGWLVAWAVHGTAQLPENIVAILTAIVGYLAGRNMPTRQE
jgi:hypothetical protein